MYGRSKVLLPKQGVTLGLIDELDLSNPNEMGILLTAGLSLCAFVSLQ